MVDRRIIVATCILLVASLGGGVAAGSSTSVDSGDAGSTLAESQSEEQIVERAVIQLADDSGDQIEAEIQYEIPDSVDSLEFSIVLKDFEVVGTDSFTQSGDRSFEWSGDGSGGSVTVRYPSDSGFYLDGRHVRPVGSGDGWSVAVRPETATDFSYFGDEPPLSYQFETAGPGIAGQDLAFLGAYDSRTADVEGEQIELVLPDAGDSAAPAADVLDSLERAADIELGGRHGNVVAISAPSDTIDWEPRGLTVGPDTRIADSTGVDQPVNIWAHEYVHTRQRQDGTTDKTRWLIEGSADYYGALISLDRDSTGFDTFADVLDRGTRDEFDDVVLSEPATWKGTDANYLKGALVTAAIDYQIRNRTDGNATFTTVMREWADSATFDQDTFLSAIESVAGSEARDLAAEWTTTTATPDRWSASEHNETFLMDGQPLIDEAPPESGDDSTDDGETTDGTDGTDDDGTEDSESENGNGDGDTSDGSDGTTSDDTNGAGGSAESDDAEDSDGFGTGFGIAIAGAAIAALSLLGRRRR